MKLVVPLFAMLAWSTAEAQERVVESVVPALAYGAGCSSTVYLQNLSDRQVVVDVEGHRSGGALVPVVDHPDIAVRLNPRERSSYKLQIEEETPSAWVKVRERVPSPDRSPVVSIGGATECLIGNQLRTVPRDVVYPTLNPWYGGDVGDLAGAMVSLINTSEHTAKASTCYSSGTLFSAPGSKASADLTPVCSSAFDVQIPPFGAREFPVAREGSSHFSIKTQGAAIVLEMLRPVEPNVRMYKVDSTIQFGSEVPTAPPKQ